MTEPVPPEFLNCQYKMKKYARNPGSVVVLAAIHGLAAMGSPSLVWAAAEAVSLACGGTELAVLIGYSRGRVQLHGA